MHLLKTYKRDSTKISYFITSRRSFGIKFEQNISWDEVLTSVGEVVATYVEVKALDGEVLDIGWKSSGPDGSILLRRCCRKSSNMFCDG